ncbi:MAG: 16S rRNA (adenine(1518)-N(6)/adenine(1519)-N(6))-dimethyltransferase RsmA [Candidatus Thorarchaeota archaeon]
MRSLSDEIRLLLNRYKVRPSKKFGQSFLNSHSIARDIVKLAKVTSQDRVLEIGGGLGMLTRWIAAEAGEVHVVEVEPGLVKALQDAAKGFNNVYVIEGDALKIELPEVNKVVANLPYSISSEVTFRLLKELKFDTAVLMYQKEFASRMVAEPGTTEYSRLTVNVQYHADVELLMDVSAEMFYPVPTVDSTVVKVTPRKEGSYAKDATVFHWMIRGIYPYPNKNIRRALQIWFRNLGHDKQLSHDVLKRAENYLEGSEKLRSLDRDTLIHIADILLEMIADGLINDPRV